MGNSTQTSDDSDGLDILWELEGACEFTLAPTEDNIEKLASSCGRAHTDINRMRKALEEMAPLFADNIKYKICGDGSDHAVIRQAYDAIAKSKGIFK